MRKPKRKQQPIFMVSYVNTDDNTVIMKYFTGVYEQEYIEDNVTKHVVPRNRQAFRIAFKKLNTKFDSKKQGTRALYNVKEQKELSETNLRKKNKRSQKIKRLLKAVDFSSPRLPNKQKESELKNNYPKIYKKFKQLVGVKTLKK